LKRFVASQKSSVDEISLLRSNIPITLIDPDFGEQTAQACAIAWLHQLRRIAAPVNTNLICAAVRIFTLELLKTSV
jgi:hypothetical protein